MIRNSRRVVALAIAGAVAFAPVISACGAGETPQTAAPTQLTDGVNAHVPQEAKVSKIDIRNMFLLGPAPDQKLAAGSSLPLYATVINQVKGQPDRLVAVTSDAFSQSKIAGGALVIPAADPSGKGSAVSLLGTAPAETPSASPTGKPSGKTSGKPTTSPSATPTTSPSASASASSEPGAEATPGAATGTGTGATAPLVLLTGLNREVGGGETVRLRLQFEHAGSVEISVPVIPRQGEYTTYAPAPEATTANPAPGTSESGAPGSPSPTTSGESESPSPTATPSAG